MSDEGVGGVAATQSLFEYWRVAECPFVIEYRPELMQELRAAAAYGQQALARGGMEVGGVLFGSRLPDSVSVRAWRPIACEHAAGPAFVLSDRDRAELKKLLQTHAGGMDLAGVEPVGWFVSHTRSDLALRDSDLALYNEFFPSPTDVCLVLRPGRHGAARAGFFFRDAHAQVRTDESLQEFNIEGSEGVRPTTPTRPLVREAERAPEPGHAASVADVAPPVNFAAAIVTSETPAAVRGSITEPENKWLSRPNTWLVVAAAAGIVFGALGAKWLVTRASGPPSAAVTPADMTVMDRNGQLLIDWDHGAARMANVRGGQLAITDGDATARFPLDANDARNGSFTWARRTGDVRIALRLDTGAKPLAAFARFVGEQPPPAAPVTQTPVPVSREPATAQQLRKENAALRASLALADARATQAENLMRILRNRLDAAEARPK